MNAQSPTPNGSQSPSPQRFFRRELRQATLILPRTGERVKRQFTLGEFDQENDQQQHSPLLTPRRRLFAHRDSGVQRAKDWAKEVVLRPYRFCKSDLGIGILKCSLAYLLGSLATFVPFIAATLGKNDGKHIVATVTVYFHPSRSAGSMLEATILALVAFVYAAFLSFTSMGVSTFFKSHDLLVFGHVVVLIVFCGGGLGLIGWIKQKLGNSLVNVACSLASLATITVLTKEGAVQDGRFSNDKVVQVLKMVLMGVSATILVSLGIKPISARKEFQVALKRCTSSLSEMLATVTRSFISGSESDLRRPAFLRASNTYKTTFGSVRQILSEAKFEHYVLGSEEEFWIYSRIITSLERMAQDLGGLRSAAATQFALLAQPSIGHPVPRSDTVSSPDARGGLFWSVDSVSGEDRNALLSSIDEEPEDSENPNTGQSSVSNVATSTDSPAHIFATFITHLGPPLKSLTFTLKYIINELPTGDAQEESNESNNNFRSSLIDAIKLFENARKEALENIHNSKLAARPTTIEAVADYEEVVSSCGYFSSTLVDFAEEAVTYLEVLEELKLVLQKTPRDRSWKWLYFWRQKQGSFTSLSQNDVARPDVNAAERGRFRPTIGPVQAPRERNNSQGDDKLGKQSFSYRIWLAVQIFRRDDVRFAIKVGMGAALYAMWSFIPSTRPVYVHWRGEWGLLSYMLVCSMTIGSSNTTGFQRFLGTCAGACLAIFAWIISVENAFALAAIGWLVSLGCFYVIIGLKKGPMGRFILLTYNLSALYAYSLSVKDQEDDEDEGGINPEIWEIVLHRVVAVLAGCIWGIIITRIVWPISARTKLRDGIALLWLRMSLIWKRDPLVAFASSGSLSSYMDIDESLELRRFLAHLEKLSGAAASEFELKGLFQDKIYKKLLQTTDKMLDSFHAMNKTINRNLNASPGEVELVKFTGNERKQMSWRISHLLSVMASSMKLEYPLNDALPNIEHARDRLLVKISEFKREQDAKKLAAEQDYELLYAYALVTGQLANDLAFLGEQIEKLYGVLDEDSLKLE